MSLTHLGWSETLRPHIPNDSIPARISRIERTRCWALAPDERMLRLPREPLAVGDWVALRDDKIVKILPRRGIVSRNAPGGVTHEQILAANVDLVLLLIPGDRPPNPGLVERALAAFPGIELIVVASKADVGRSGDIPGMSLGYPGSISVSVVDGRGLDALRAALQPHKTAVLLGPSGAGKSSLANALLGYAEPAGSASRQRFAEEDALEVGAVREHDHKGRQTTTRRELRVVPTGGVIIDTPGLRILPLWDADVGAVFDDITALAARCRFTDCAHQSEPGCAVRGAVDERRLESWRKLQREAARQSMRREERGRLGADARHHVKEMNRWAKDRVRAKRGEL